MYGSDNDQRRWSCFDLCVCICIYISGWVFQKDLTEIVRKGLILSQKGLISNRRNLRLFAPKSMRFPSVPAVEKDRLPPTLLSFIISFHNQMHSKVSYNDASSESCKILIGVKQGCVLAPTLSGIFFSVLLNIPHSITPRRESTCTQEATANCSDCPD